MLSSRASTASIETRFSNHVQRNRVRWREPLFELDKAKSGVLPYAQMRRYFSLCSFPINDADFYYLCGKYDQKRNGFVDYVGFLDTARLQVESYVESVQPFSSRPGSSSRPSNTMRMSSSNGDHFDYEGLLHSLRQQTATLRIPVRQAFLDFDRNRTGHISVDQFHRALDKCGFRLQDADFENLVKRLQHKSIQKQVVWSDFCAEIESVFGAADLSRTPRSPAPPRSGRPDYRRPSSKPSIDINSIIQGIASSLRLSAFDLKPLFRDYDRINEGRVTAEQYRRILDQVHYSLSEEDFALLLRQYSVFENGRTMVVYQPFLDDIQTAGKPVVTPDMAEHAESTLREALEHYQRNEIVQAMHAFDQDGSGLILESRFRQVLNRFDHGLTSDEIGAVISKLGVLEDEYLNYYDFLDRLFLDSISSEKHQPSSRPTPVPMLKLPLETREMSQEIKQIIAKVQLRVVDAKVRIHDFFKDYDRLRCGSITDAQCRRALNLAGCKLTENEIRTILENYRGKTPGSFMWNRFCDDIDSVFTVKHLERTPRVQTSSARNDLKYKASSQAHQPVVEDIVRSVLNRLQEVISRQRIIPGPPFQDFDRMRCGRVTVTQFQQALAVLGLSVTSVEINALMSKYGLEIDGLMTMRYREFLDDLKTADKFASDATHLNKLEQILREKILQNVGGSGHLRKAFRYFDRDMTGQITEIQFGNVCRQLGMNLTEEEVRGLMSRYDIDQDGTIDYLEFIDRLMPRDYGIEKAPTSGVVKETDIPTFSPKKLNSAVTELGLLFPKLKAHVLEKNIRLQDFFSDFDVHRRHVISKSQFRRGLSRAGFRLEDEEVQTLTEHYAAKESDLVKWTAFVDDVCSAIVPMNLERNPLRDIKILRPRDLLIESMGTLPSDVLAAEVKSIMRSIAKEVNPRRIFTHIATAFRDFDTHHVRQVKAENFNKVMKLFEIELTQKEIQHLQAQYAEEVDGALFFRYDEFMTDLREACNPLPDNPRVMVIIKQLRDKIAQKISGGAFEIRRAFRCFDKDGSGQITSAEFREVLEQYNIMISDEDLQELMKYIDSEGFGFVGYYDFVEKCLPKDYIGPQMSVNEKAKSVTDTPFSSARKALAPKPPVDLDRLYQRIRGHISSHRIRLASFLRDGDRHNTGALTRDQFHRALTNAGISVDDSELDALCSAFGHARHSGSIDWHAFDAAIDSGMQSESLL
eukprot:TRINITY_DN8140_c0_g1_i2.p1 TRINITY_DN8140_c0_g1~~TRINITY_DN8140_c0_g1_i2.p1  ORF type:complete len:1204 (-),score=221.71 TRINITY_DN8140_c0_g1_i2:627-4238(-)